MTLIIVRAEVRPTEEVEKVKQAILNFFDPDSIEVLESGDYKTVVARATSLSSLRKLHASLRRERILDAARKVLRASASGDFITFQVNKQAAYQGRLSFVTSPSESPLGPIEFHIEHPNVREVIDWLTPKTQRGRPLWDKPQPED